MIDHVCVWYVSGRFGALKSDSIHHFFRNACTKSGSLRFSQFSGCWLILSVYMLMSFDFPFVRLFGNFVITLTMSAGFGSFFLWLFSWIFDFSLTIWYWLFSFHYKLFYYTLKLTHILIFVGECTCITWKGYYQRWSYCFQLKFVFKANSYKHNLWWVFHTDKFHIFE